MSDTIKVKESPKPQWSYKFFKESDITFFTVKAPNMFYRIMQRFILGIHYERIKR